MTLLQGGGDAFDPVERVEADANDSGMALNFEGSEKPSQISTSGSTA